MCPGSSVGGAHVQVWSFVLDCEAVIQYKVRYRAVASSSLAQGALIVLRNLVWTPDMDVCEVYIVRNIKKKYMSKIKIPKEITKDLAEETGLHIGDGSMNY